MQCHLYVVAYMWRASLLFFKKNLLRTDQWGYLGSSIPFTNASILMLMLNVTYRWHLTDKKCLLLYLIPGLPGISIDGFENKSIDKAAVGNIVVDEQSHSKNILKHPRLVFGTMDKFSDSWRWGTSYDFQKENGKSENETKYFHEITRSNNKFTSRRLLSMFFLSAYKDRFSERWCKVHSELPMALIKVIESYRFFLKNWTNLGMSTKK